MSENTGEKQSETVLKRRYVRPTLAARGRLQTLTGDSQVTGAIT